LERNVAADWITLISRQWQRVDYTLDLGLPALDHGRIEDLG
jgi:hypothetical protein